MILFELEQKLKQSGDAKKEASFFAPDGALISKSTKLLYLLHIPYFVLKLDNKRNINVLSEKSFSLRNQKFTLNPNEKVVYDDCKDMNMPDKKALEISRFVSEF